MLSLDDLRFVGVIADAFAYVKLPVAAATDVQKIELVDLRGDGSRVVLAQVRQSGGGGGRSASPIACSAPVRPT